jgi:hypothetical protein
MEIPIEFDTGSGNIQSCFGLIALIAMISALDVWPNLQFTACHEKIFRSKFPNLTSADSNLSCNVYYDDCVCSVFSYRSSESEYCVNAILLILSRISTPIIFILSCLLLWHIFSFSKNCTDAFVFFLRILFLLILIGITIGTHWNECFHHYISLCIYASDELLTLAMVYNHCIIKKREDAKRRLISIERANFSRST